MAQWSEDARGVPWPTRATLPDGDRPFDVVTTIAGTGKPGFVDGDLRQAYFDRPSDLCVLSDGSVLVCDMRNNVLRRVTLQGGEGGDSDGPTASGKPHVETLATNAFLWPHAPVAIDSGAAVLVCDSGHHKIRLLQFFASDPNGKEKEEGGPPARIRFVQDSVIAGTGLRGWSDGPADTSTFDGPTGLCVLRDGSLLVADTNNNAIRRVAVRPGRRGLHVTTIMGGGPPGFADGNCFTAMLHKPGCMVLDKDGTVLVCDTGNHAVRALHPPVDGLSLDAWTLSTVAGGPHPGFADGAASTAMFNMPTSLAVTGDGKLYVTDCGNNAVRCLRSSGSLPKHQVVLPQSPSHPSYAGEAGTRGGEAGTYTAPADVALVHRRYNHVSTVAGAGPESPTKPSRYADGLFSEARFLHPVSIAVLPDSGGMAVVADRENHLLRLLVPRTVFSFAPAGLKWLLPPARVVRGRRSSPSRRLEEARRAKLALQEAQAAAALTQSGPVAVPRRAASVPRGPLPGAPAPSSPSSSPFPSRLSPPSSQRYLLHTRSSAARVASNGVLITDNGVVGDEEVPPSVSVQARVERSPPHRVSQARHPTTDTRNEAYLRQSGLLAVNAHTPSVARFGGWMRPKQRRYGTVSPPKAGVLEPKGHAPVGSVAKPVEAPHSPHWSAVPSNRVPWEAPCPPRARAPEHTRTPAAYDAVVMHHPQCGRSVTPTRRAPSPHVSMRHSTPHTTRPKDAVTAVEEEKPVLASLTLDLARAEAKAIESRPPPPPPSSLTQPWALPVTQRGRAHTPRLVPVALVNAGAKRWTQIPVTLVASAPR